MGNVRHLDAARLVELGNALDWAAEDVEHIVGCVTCRNDLGMLGAARRTLSEEVDLPPTFTDSVIANLPTRTTRPIGAHEYRWVSVVNGALGAAIAFFVLALGVHGDSGLPIGPWALAVSILAGLLTAVRSIDRESRSSTQR